ncbi:MAG: hypothetical protein EOO07_30450, partial [Chitinophagaceae bacterium]
MLGKKMSNITWILIGSAMTLLGGGMVAFFTFREAKNSSAQINRIDSTGAENLTETRALKQ